MGAAIVGIRARGHLTGGESGQAEGFKHSGRFTDSMSGMKFYRLSWTLWAVGVALIILSWTGVLGSGAIWIGFLAGLVGIVLAYQDVVREHWAKGTFKGQLMKYRHAIVAIICLAAFGIVLIYANATDQPTNTIVPTADDSAANVALAGADADQSADILNETVNSGPDDLETDSSVDTLDGTTNSQAARPELATVDQRVSYALGLRFGRHLVTTTTTLDVKFVVRGLIDALTNQDPLLTDADFQETMIEVGRRAKVLALQRSQAFLAENGKKDSVITRPSGLQYEVLQEGEGNSPDATDKVLVHARAMLPDGREIQNTYKRGMPLTLDLSVQMVGGIAEGLPLMKEGAKYRFYLPPHLAYGERGTPIVGPNAVVIYEVELIEIVE